MNHCLLEVEVKSTPTVRYTQDNKTPIAEMEVSFDGLRPDDQPSQLKVVGWGTLAQELQERVSIGQKLVLEGRLRMNTLSRDDGTKEKIAEFTLSRMHPFNSTAIAERSKGEQNSSFSSNKAQEPLNSNNQTKNPGINATSEEESNWNSAPLIPDTDDIPF